MQRSSECCSFFFFNDTATTEIYTLSLHDALPICEDRNRNGVERCEGNEQRDRQSGRRRPTADRKSTRLNSSHGYISYAVFCLKKKKRVLREPEELTERAGPQDKALHTKLRIGVIP